jgi:ankyrin repeat protein
MKINKHNSTVLAILFVCLGVMGLWFYPKLQQARLNQALIEAVKDSNHTRIQALLDAGANPNANTGGIYPTLLIIAADRNDEASVRLLLAHHAKVDAKGIYGQTALQYALNSYYYANPDKYPIVIRLLLEHGANPSLANDVGQTSLERAKLDRATTVPFMRPGWHDEALPLLTRIKS